MDKIKKILKNLDFNEKEIKIYFALLKQNKLSALEISRITSIDRTTTYDVLDKMISKGIVSYKLINKTKKFNCLGPNQLLIYFKDKFSSLELILPSLNKIANKSKANVNCELFQGKHGLKIILKELINNAKEYRVIGFKKEFEDILGYFNDQGIIKINKSKIKEIAILEKISKIKKTKNGIYKYVNKKLLSPITTVLYNDVVIFFIWTNPYFAIKVQNRDFYNAQLEYFNLIWEVAE